MPPLSPFKLRPARPPEGGFTFRFENLKKVGTDAEVRRDHATIKNRKKKLEKKSDLTRLTVDDELKGHFSGCEDLAYQGRALSEDRCSVGSLQSPIEAVFTEFQEDSSESDAPAQTDLTGFLEAVVELANPGEDYDSLHQSNDEMKELARNNWENSKDHHGHPGHRIDNLPTEVGDPVVETSELSCGTPSSIITSTSIPTSSQSATKSVFDPLCDLLTKISLQGSDQKSSRRVKIPKAYKFSMSTEPKCHYDQVHYYKAGTNRQSLTGNKRVRDDLGFKPHEVIEKGALHAADLDVICSLAGNIHAVFDEEQWTDCPHHVYEVIKPALLLASKLLTTPQCLQHFQTVLKGNRQYCLKTSLRKQKDCYRIREDAPLNPKSAQELQKYIESMAGSVTFQFLPSSSSPTEANKFFATAKMVPYNHSSCSTSVSQSFKQSERFGPVPRTTKPQSTIVSLHIDFYTQAQRLCRLQYPDPAQALRFQFFLALNLMHEFAHAFEISCNPAETRKGMEVHMYDWLEAESGRAWETNVFGGFVTAINSRCDGLHGLCVLEWPEPGLTDPLRAGQADVWSVPMSFINSLFQESYWEAIGKRSINDKSLLTIPRTGATSVGVSSFTTAKFEEVLEDREMGCLELALKEIEEQTRYPEIDDSNYEEERRCNKRRNTYIPRAWIKSMGRRGGL